MAMLVSQRSTRRKSLPQRGKRVLVVFVCAETFSLNMFVLMSRLSTTARPPTLPEGVTLRDDPMTKTIAFLNSTPDLA